MKKGLLIILTFIFSFANAQKAVKDSLIQLLKTQLSDSVKIVALNSLAWEYKTARPDTSIILSQKALDLAKKNDLMFETIIALRQLGWFVNLKGNYAEAKDYFVKGLEAADKAEQLYPSLKDKIESQKARIYSNFGSVYLVQSDYPKSLDYYLKALPIFEKLNNKLEIGKTYGNLGIVYGAQNNYDKGLEYHFKALKIKEEIGDKVAINNTLGNIGTNYSHQKKHAEALVYFLRSIKIAEEIGDINGVAVHSGNIAAVYEKQKKYPEALEYYLRALHISEKLGNQYETAIWYNGLGSFYLTQKKFAEAESNMLTALKINTGINRVEGLKEVNLNLSTLYEAKGDFPKALKFYKDFILTRDSIINEENTKKLVRTEMNFEFDKKEAATRLEQEKKEAVAMAESKKQRIIIYSVCGILLLVIAFAAFAYRSYLDKQKANVEIVRQKDIIEEKQKAILDSIYYARRIQRALITNEKYIDRNLEKLTKKV